MDDNDLRKYLLSDYLAFTKHFFKAKTGREFVCTPPTSRRSHYEIISDELEDVFNLRCKRLIINVPPGHGKSTLLVYFVAWSLAHYPDSNFIYVSYSSTLAEKHTATIKEIVEMPLYKYLFDVELRSDSKAKGSFKTTQGGNVMAFGSSGSITGCFAYESEVFTENGIFQIGFLVENKLAFSVPCFNIDKGTYELKRITNWFTNPENDILRIEFDNGEILECTPDHKILTINRGWVRSDNLCDRDILNSIIFSNSYNNRSAQTSFLGKCSRMFRFVHDKIKLLFSNAFYFFSVLRSFTFSYTLAYSSHPYVNNSSTRNSKFFSDFDRRNVFKSSFTYLQNKFLAKLFPFHNSSMFSSIIHIIFSCTITKIFNPIVEPISIQMTRINSFFSGTYKNFGNNLMNSNFFSFPISHYCNTIITHCVNPWLKIFRWIWNFKSIFINMNSSIASNSSVARNTIPIAGSRNVSPVRINIIKHVNKTYCLEVEDNHNFIINTGIGSIVVSNCDAGLPNLDRFSGMAIMDDCHKPDEVFSDLLRSSVIENYNQTIKPRPRGPNVPMVFIGQRLHEDDLGAFLINNKDGYNWKKVILKAIDDAGNALCPQINSLEMLRIEQEHNPYVFSSQYQQDPQPAGGGIFKPDWFVTLDENPKIIHTFITCDTAETSKDYNDATAFSFWGMYKIAIRGVDTGMYGLHWLDAKELHIEPKDLESEFFDFYSSCMRFHVKPKFVAIEKKSTGVTLLSILKDAQGLRVIDIERTRASGNKTSRFLQIQPFVSKRQISLPTYGKHTSLCIEHCRKITANDTHRRDDLADTLYDAVKLSLIDNMLIPKDSSQSDEVLAEMAGRFNTVKALKENRRW